MYYKNESTMEEIFKLKGIKKGIFELLFPTDYTSTKIN